MRKQSLHILKTVLQISGKSQACSGGSERKSQEKHSNPRGMTKRELWAAKEAKSLGVGKLCNSVDSGLKGRQQWEAFILLYEMLEEYGTHLVEAAWNHQVTIHFFCSSCDLSVSLEISIKIKAGSSRYGKWSFETHLIPCWISKYIFTPQFCTSYLLNA